jgi:hypothetical protein
MVRMLLDENYDSYQNGDPVNTNGFLATIDDVLKAGGK